MSGKLLKSTFTVGAMTTLSRALGLVRDMVIANVFRVGLGTDAFFVAFRIPNFLRRLFAEGAFSQAFVPVLSEYKSQRSQEEVKDLVDHVAGTHGVVLLLITLLGVAAAPVVILLFAFGFADEPTKYQMAVEMLRLTFPYLFFISLVAMAGAVLNSYSHFWASAFTPVLLNLCLIGCALWLAPQLAVPVKALAWGVLLAGLAQLLFQIPFLARYGLLPRPRWGWRHEGVRRISKLMLPAIFGSSVVQINLLFDTLIASFLVTGSVTWLYYSDRLVEFPLGVFGIALATVILPSLSRQHAEASPQQFSETLDWALKLVLLIGLPATLGLLLLAQPILATLFLHGAFTARDVSMSSLSLMAYALGLLGFIMVKILAPGFYARQDTRTPVRIGIIAMLWNMLLNVLFVVPMVLLDYRGPHAGLALATAASAYINALMLLRLLRRQQVYHPGTGWARLLRQVIIAAVVMGTGLAWFAGDLEQWLAWNTWQRIGHLGLLVLGGALAYGLVLLLQGLKPHEFMVKKPGSP
jgi:putative peptidoglycan lipid II flippase